MITVTAVAPVEPVYAATHWGPGRVHAFLHYCSDDPTVLTGEPSVVIVAEGRVYEVGQGAEEGYELYPTESGAALRWSRWAEQSENGADLSFSEFIHGS